ncbi:hypothetical protein PanWU01x14_050580 [Parasponia andersonii]|uniref:Uncharacterized protein n=1 Tax=Parasponia andersonii TaxID=3476 RepID=A0A2P5DLR3_PARAD|nr:hypothetical protein PanWU01x14_050580 [Parasponia andersonii]
MAAALLVRPSFHTKKRQFPEDGRSQRSVVFVCCLKSREPIHGSTSSKLKAKEEISNKEGKQEVSFPMSFVGFEKLGKSLRENLSPKQKGDWKDLMLMSLSFAVYVYISQRIVCAYLAWMSMPEQLW